MKKKYMYFVVLLSMLFLVTGCQKEEQKFANPDGTALSYKEDELPEGMFVLKDKQYVPVLNLGPDIMLNNTYIWFTGYDKAIPVLEKGDKLAFYSTQTIPSELQFSRLNDFGYTVGIKFEKDKEFGNLIFPFNAEGYNPTSPVQNYMMQAVIEQSKGSTVAVKEVNGKEFKETMLSVDGFMKGLTKDAMYKFYYYQGTVYKDINIKADTHVFLKDYMLPSSSYEQLKDKIFIVNLPSSITDGYWYVEGFGMFRYVGDEKSVIQERHDDSEPADQIKDDDSEDSADKLDIKKDNSDKDSEAVEDSTDKDSSDKDATSDNEESSEEDTDDGADDESSEEYE